MKRILFVLSFFISTLCAESPLHTKVLHTQVRVQTTKAGGSGTVIYSEKADEFFPTYIITCHHVIEDALRVEEKWDPLLGKPRKQEARQSVTVEFFNYGSTPHGKPPLTSGTVADIVTYDVDHDMALLRLRLSQQAKVAKLLPPGKVTEVIVGSPTVAVGCALLHDPVLTTGIITHLGDIIEYKDYWMSNAQIIYGNSGGGMFFVDGGEYFFIGLPSRIAITFGGQAITHMGYFSPITRVYDFFREQLFDFLIPGSTATEVSCKKARDEKKSLEERKLQ